MGQSATCTCESQLKKGKSRFRFNSIPREKGDSTVWVRIPLQGLLQRKSKLSKSNFYACYGLPLNRCPQCLSHQESHHGVLMLYTNHKSDCLEFTSRKNSSEEKVFYLTLFSESSVTTYIRRK